MRFSAGRRLCATPAVHNDSVMLCCVQAPAAFEAQVDISKPTSYRRTILEADVLELPCSGLEGERCSMLALHLRGTAFLWHQVN